MEKVKLNKLVDGGLFRRTKKSRTWFKVITHGKFGVVVTSTKSEYSALMKGSTEVFI